MKLFIQIASTAIAVVLLSLVFDITITPKYWGKPEECEDKRHTFIKDGIEVYSYITISKHSGKSRYENYNLDSIIGCEYYYSEPKASMKLAKPEVDTVYDLSILDDTLQKIEYYKLKLISSGGCDSITIVYRYYNDSIDFVTIEGEVSNINTSDL